MTPALIAAAPDLLAAAMLAAPHRGALIHGPTVSIRAEAYAALCAAITKALQDDGASTRQDGTDPAPPYEPSSSRPSQ